MRKYNLNIAAAVCALMTTLTVAVPAGAVTRYVPSPYPTIQGAIDASAMTGDEIEVAPGTYNEAINFHGKAVRLYSSGGASVTTIIGILQYHVVQCVSGEDPNTILEGFTITGGNANGTEPNDRRGGGMHNSGSSPTVKNCTFSFNTAFYGGGMYNYNSSPTVIGCVFHRNYTGNGSPGSGDGGDGVNGGYGAGMYNEHSSPAVNNCIFSENITGNGGDGAFSYGLSSNGGNGGAGGQGAGMYNKDSSPILTNCIFIKNRCGSGGNGGYALWQDGGNGGAGGNGGGICDVNSSPVMTDCSFSENAAGNGGKGNIGTGGQGNGGGGGDGGHAGGLYNLQSSSPIISNCTFTKNMTGKGGNGAINGDRGHILPVPSAGGDGGSGAGIYNVYGCSPDIDNCSFTENVCGNGGNGGRGSNWYVVDPIYPANVGYGGPGGNGGSGGGLYTASASAVVRNCVFSRNRAGDGGCGGHGGSYFSVGFYQFAGTGGDGGHGGSGGGIGTWSCDPHVTKCEFTDNKSGSGGNGGNAGVVAASLLVAGPGSPGSGGNGGWGAGISFHAWSWPDVNSCSFLANSTGNGGLRGRYTYAGLWSLFILAAELDRPWLPANGERGFGGGIGILQSSPVISNCIFRNNIALYGGGMHNSEGSPTVTNCTFKENQARIKGGGMYSSASSPTVTNCIFWEDVPDEIAGSPTNVTYCDVEGGYAGTGNINSIPAFVDDAGRLSLGSICIDVGSNSAPNLPAKDFDGWPRIMGTTVDMGAFEYTADLRIRNITKDILYASIPSAINDANDGDEICVLPGTYFSAIDFKGKAIRLFSATKPNFTVINGNGAYHAVQCISGEGADTILEGFAITGGNANGASAPDNCGGGMYIKDSSPTIINCIFSENAGYDGAGMYNTSSSPAMTNCNFSYNDATHNGGGMYNINSSNPIMTNCSFSYNTSAAYGGGICNVLSSSPALTNCNFTENEAGGGGGMINSVNCSPTIINCVYMGNSANYGGGIYNNNSIPIVTNCTFTNNTAITYGGAIRNGYSSPTVTNCILWDDTPDEISNDASSSPVVTYCDVKMPSGTYPGFGNINADPGFFAGRIHYRPQYALYLASSTSPCVDAGDSNVPGLPSEDADGQPRICDGDIDDNPAVDMGAYEFRPRVTNTTRDSWYQLIQAAVMDANEADHIVVSPGTYYDDYVDFSDGPDLVLTSADPNDPEVVAQTIIIGRVSFCSQSRLCVFAGFTITSDPDGSGGGIGSYCGLAPSPTIRNCVITNADGIELSSGSALISGCTIRGNHHAGLALGGTAGSNITVEDCIITDHYDVEAGCAVLIRDGNTILTRCIISANLADPCYGTVHGILCRGNAVLKDCVITNNSGVGINGGICPGKISGCTISNNESGISGWAGPIENCIITGNGPRDFGGGIEGCTGPITGCLIERNEAWYGGGIASCSGPITNCIIAANRARSQYGGDGGGLAWCNGTISNCTIVGNVAWNDEFENPGLGGGLYECTGTITNSIIWQNSAQADGDQLYSSSVPSYSCIQDWPGGGVGNIAADPCFVYAGYWADFNDPNTVVEPNDPNAVWVGGFYRLDRNSPCIDAGDNNSVPADISDLDADGDVNEPVPFDLVGLPRFIEDLCAVDSGNPGTPGPPLVDMGAYEFLPADIDSSGAVNLYDLSMLALHLGETGCGRCGGANLNCDGKVDFNDLRLLTNWWLAGIEPEL